MDDSLVSGWGTIEHFFERTEFQNRGAAHLHTVLWTTSSIEEMMQTSQIRADLPDATHEPELYRKILLLSDYNLTWGDKQNYTWSYQTVTQAQIPFIN